MGKIFTDESGELTFDFSACDSAYRADDVNYTGLSAVDFIAETSEDFYFIEVKNLDNSSIPIDLIATQKEKFLIKVDGNEFKRDICSKIKDSLLKKIALGQKIAKPVTYILVLEYKALDSSQRRRLYLDIGSNIPRFSEPEYTAIHSIKFDLCSKTEYDSKYQTFLAR